MSETPRLSEAEVERALENDPATQEAFAEETRLEADLAEVSAAWDAAGTEGELITDEVQRREDRFYYSCEMLQEQLEAARRMTLEAASAWIGGE